MKKILAGVLLFAALAMPAWAQTNFFAIYSFVNGFGVTQNVRQVSFTPLTSGVINGQVIATNETFAVVTQNYLTNAMITGLAYRVKYFSSQQPPIVGVCFTNYFPTNIAAGSIVSAAAYTALSTNLGNGLYALTQAQANSLYAPIGLAANAITNTQTGVTLNTLHVTGFLPASIAGLNVDNGISVDGGQIFSDVSDFFNAPAYIGDGSRLTGLTYAQLPGTLPAASIPSNVITNGTTSGYDTLLRFNWQIKTNTLIDQFGDPFFSGVFSNNSSHYPNFIPMAFKIENENGVFHGRLDMYGTNYANNPGLYNVGEIGFGDYALGFPPAADDRIFVLRPKSYGFDGVNFYGGAALFETLGANLNPDDPLDYFDWLFADGEGSTMAIGHIKTYWPSDDSAGAHPPFTVTIVPDQTATHPEFGLLSEIGLAVTNGSGAFEYVHGKLYWTDEQTNRHVLIGSNGIPSVANGIIITNAIAPTNTQPIVSLPGIAAGSGATVTIFTNSGHYSDSIFTVQLITGTATVANTNLFTVTYGTPINPNYAAYEVFSHATPTNWPGGLGYSEVHIPFNLQTTNGFQFWAGASSLTATQTNAWTFMRVISQ